MWSVLRQSSIVAPRLILVALVITATLTLAADTASAESRCREWSTSGAEVCNKSFARVNIGSGVAQGTYFDSHSYKHSALPDCYYLQSKGFNNYGGWHLSQNVRAPNFGGGCFNAEVDPDMWISFVHANGTRMGPREPDGDYVCDLAAFDCYGTTLFHFEDTINPPPAPNNITGYTSEDGAPSAACFNATESEC